MTRRILIIDQYEEDYLHIKSLLGNLDAQSNTVDWLKGWDDVVDQAIFRQYDIILAMNATGRESPNPHFLKGLELSELKSRFITMASHEFRTPLTSIASSADLIQAYLSRGEYDKVERHVARIKSNVNDLNAILSEFLSMDKLEEGKTKAYVREMNLPQLVEDVCEEFDHLLKSDQKIHYRHEGNKSIWLDPMLLKISIINLLSNASKYAPPNSAITINTEVSPESITLSIQDQGIGIPKEDQPRLFDRFYRARNATNIQGTGLGLFLTKSYVEMMGGTIGYSSELGSGSTFWLTFPTTKLT